MMVTLALNELTYNYYIFVQSRKWGLFSYSFLVIKVDIFLEISGNLAEINLGEKILFYKRLRLYQK